MKSGVIVLAVLLFPFVLLAGGCDRAPAPLPVIRIGHALHDHHAALYIAAMNPEYFRENGGVFLREISARSEYELVAAGQLLARLRITAGEGGIRLIRKLDEELLDLSYGGMAAMLSLIDQGSDLRILAPVMGEGSGFVVAEEMPAHSWDSFVEYAKSRTSPVRVGYKIGVSVQNIIFAAALREAGIPYAYNNENPEARVVLVNVHGSENLFALLQNGIIDGFVINQPLVAMAEVRKIGRLLVPLSELPPAGRWTGIPCCALAGNEAFVRKHPREVEALLALLMRANLHVKENPQRSAAQIADWLGIAPEIEEKSIPTINYSNAFDHNWHRGVEQWLDTMIEAGELQGRVREARQAGEVDDLLYSSASRKLRQAGQ